MTHLQTNRNIPQDEVRITLFSIPTNNMATVRARVKELRQSLVGPSGIPTGSYVGILDGYAGTPGKVVMVIVVGSPTDDDNARPYCAHVLESLVLDRILFDLDELEPDTEEEIEVKEKLRNRFVEDFGINL